jgi:hypothetical protein
LHAVIVAGPSGAGKTTFLTELRAGRLEADVRRHLPVGVEAWPHVDSCIPRQWEPFLVDADCSSRTTGFVVHYDMTRHWNRLEQDFSRDPFWQLLHRCECATLVLIQPSPSRLLRQWSLRRLGMAPWQVHMRRLVGRLAFSLLALLRRLRRKHPRRPQRLRYPRPVRFLKYVDHLLHRYRPAQTGSFDFYRRRRNVEDMMQAWDEVTAALTAAFPVTRLHLVPDPAHKIAHTFGWIVTAVETKPAPAASRKLVLAAG